MTALTDIRDRTLVMLRATGHHGAAVAVLLAAYLQGVTDRAAGKDGESQMRVYTADCGVFEVTDTLLRMRFDAADRYAALLPGRRYQLTTVGFRVPALSLFPNVIDARDVTRG